MFNLWQQDGHLVGTRSDSGLSWATLSTNIRALQAGLTGDEGKDLTFIRTIIAYLALVLYGAVCMMVLYPPVL